MFAAEPYQPLRYDGGSSFLRDPARRTEALDAVKYVPVGPTA
jgi:hypothetical protein